MPRYASSTDVPADRSRAQIEAVLHKYGARSFAYATDTGDDGHCRAMIGFKILTDDRGPIAVRMLLPMPDPAEKRFTRTPTGKPRGADAATKEWEQATRASWRALLLVVKAKLEAVEAGISTVEREFMADVLLPGGITVGDMMHEQRDAIEAGARPTLLAVGRGRGH